MGIVPLVQIDEPDVELASMATYIQTESTTQRRIWVVLGDHSLVCLGIRSHLQYPARKWSASISV